MHSRHHHIIPTHCHLRHQQLAVQQAQKVTVNTTMEESDHHMVDPNDHHIDMTDQTTDHGVEGVEDHHSEVECQPEVVVAGV